ncbi:MAG: pyruvate ferredoxin oxidoreductase [Promethearchaeota archaeon]|nr:MAG: pyruvate ferredoxin oxidoreductase [Candidatus Lokiarchaeota archaeon]
MSCKCNFKRTGEDLMSQEHLKENTKIISGNKVAAWAARYARVQVISAYPITPQTTIVEKLSDFVDSEKWNCEYVRVESEHSVMGFLVGASFAGTRTFSATSGQGLFYMNEMLHWAPPSRLPIVLGVADRGVAPGWNIWADHQDVVASRDTGWLILFASSHQDIFDTIIQAYRIAEDPKVYLPIMVCLEGFQLTHTNEPVYFPDQSLVDEFLLDLPKNGWPHTFLDPERPITFGSLQIPGGENATPQSMYFEFRAKIDQAHNNTKAVIEKSAKEFKSVFGRDVGGLIKKYKCDDAEAVLVCQGNISRQARIAVDRLRKDGYKVGTIKLRSYKPFPSEEFNELANNGVKGFGVMERSMAFSLNGGATVVDLKSALYDSENKPYIVPFIAGVGGRDITVENQMESLKRVLNVVKNKERNVEAEYVNFHGRYH